MGICNGEIKGDPDIAGTGVVAAIFINAIVAIILSIILRRDAAIPHLHRSRVSRRMPDRPLSKYHLDSSNRA
ncbi:hypothetical protein JMJ35_008497 [Cladonia borealis]|uniref:Uncharacterized protein n=1 Tax=Cladonia borealis TaxID=184061 RepID=A0AA39U6X8_9LECA|nr:hypothetical protein JMJ35_008497 [Cladonia borealis]